MALSKYDQAYLTAAQQKEIRAATEAWNSAKAAGDQAGMEEANRRAEEVRRAAGYSGGADGSGYFKTETPKQPVTAERADTAALKEQMREALKAEQERSASRIDSGVAENIAALTAGQKEAEEAYQAQRERIDLEEALAKDAQALYAEVRGDRGGIGAAQYDAIANTAAQNRLAVTQAQTKLAADTAARIARLRAQGEFEKADQALALTQEYLGKLVGLEKWAAEYNLSAAKFAESMNQWQAEYEAKLAQTETAAEQWQREFDYKTRQKDLAEAGKALLDLGILPSDAQLAAMGLSRAQAQSYMAAAKVKAASSGGGKTGSSGSSSGSGSSGSSSAAGKGEYALYLAAMESGGDPRTYVKSHYKDYGLTVLPVEGSYKRWQEHLKGPMGAQAFAAFLEKVNITLSEDTVDAAGRMTEPYWPAMTREQRQRVAEVYARYGKDYVYGA